MSKAKTKTKKETPKEELERIHREIEKLESRKEAIYAASLSAPPEEKVCEDSLAEMLSEDSRGGFLKFPIVVSGITYKTRDAVQTGWMRKAKTGTFVAIRPVDKALDGKTFLGLYIGDIATSTGAFYHRETGVLGIGSWMYNPAIWVFDLGRIVFGYESWWGPIEKEEDLRQITDVDIQNVWYVKALKSLVKTEA